MGFYEVLKGGLGRYMAPKEERAECFGARPVEPQQQTAANKASAPRGIRVSRRTYSTSLNPKSRNTLNSMLDR